MGRLRTIARRSFLIGSAAIVGGVAFGTWAYRRPLPNPVAGTPGAAALTPYVLIDAQGVTVIAPRAEMGQGIQTTLAALVAEEMDLDWEQVRVMHGPAARAYYNAAMLEEGVPFRPTDTGWLAETAREAMHVPARFLGLQLTGGSTSIPDGYEKMRAAGAVARAALVAAAARRTGLAEGSLTTASGAVVLPDGTRLAYAELAAEAAAVDLPDTPPLRPRSAWRLLGRALPRLDMVAKCTGTAIFTADIRLPGMLFATARTNPGLGAGAVSHDPAPALAVPGVRAVMPVPNGFAVVAENTWAAFRGAEALVVDWAPAPYAATTAELEAQVAASFTPERQDSRNRDDGDVAAVLAAGATLEAAYHVPYLAHATMEPMTAAAWLQDGRVQVWAGNQFPTQVAKMAAEICALSEEAVEVHTLVMGGGFGRRADLDFVAQALHLARDMAGTPVLLTWTREEDMTHDGFRPMAEARVTARLEGGRIAALDLSVAAGSIPESLFGRMGLPVPPGPDATIVQGAWEAPYALPAFRVTGYRVPAGVPLGFWRSVGASQNAFFLESAVDELAHLAGADPLEFRLAHLDHGPSRAVLEAVRDMSGWGTAPPAGRARGVAFCLSFGVPTAQVIEVEQTPQGIRLTGAWAAVDVGVALDPGIIEAQVQGAMVYGLSAALTGEVTFDGGHAQQVNFPDADPLRLSQCPPIAVRVLESGGRIRGVGEPGTPPAAPALANAIFALTGQRLRRLPLNKALAFA
ncbi:MAG TPA: molybdopterin cofactor-binding domain-containing protein [Paracoccaceae bacterium]|nr:molybdopterin cofactor-binding domain-containing protein [Paracoccaceae bacterium]